MYSNDWRGELLSRLDAGRYYGITIHSRDKERIFRLEPVVALLKALGIRPEPAPDTYGRYLTAAPVYSSPLHCTLWYYAKETQDSLHERDLAVAVLAKHSYYEGFLGQTIRMRVVRAIAGSAQLSEFTLDNRTPPGLIVCLQVEIINSHLVSSNRFAHITLVHTPPSAPVESNLLLESHISPNKFSRAAKKVAPIHSFIIEGIVERSQ